MKIFTVRNGTVTEGAKIEKLTLKGAGVEIDAVIVGEEGRGRERGVLPVQGAPTDGLLRYATVGQTKAGKSKLVAAQQAGNTDACIVVFRTEAGYRGGANHTGDNNGLRKIEGLYPAEKNRAGMTLAEARAWCAANDICTNHIRMDGFAPFPGQIICKGEIAQGTAGYMGGNQQIVAVMPAGVWFRTGYSGRLYGAPPAHYYRFGGERLIGVTWDERQMLDEVTP